MRSEEKLVVVFGFPRASGLIRRLPAPSRESRKIKPFESRVQERGKAPMDTTGRSNCLIEGPRPGEECPGTWLACGQLSKPPKASRRARAMVRRQRLGSTESVHRLSAVS